MQKKYFLLVPRLSLLPSLAKVSDAKNQWFFRKIFLYCFRRNQFSSRFHWKLRQQFFQRNLSGPSSSTASVFWRFLRLTPFSKRSFQRFFFNRRQSLLAPSAKASRWYAFLRKKLPRKRWFSRTTTQRIRWLRQLLRLRRSTFNLTKRSFDRFLKKSRSRRAVKVKSKSPLPSPQSPSLKKSKFHSFRRHTKGGRHRSSSKFFKKFRRPSAKKKNRKKKPRSLFLFTRRLFRRRMVLPRKRKSYVRLVSPQNFLLLSLVKRTLFTQQTLSPLLLNRFAFSSKEFSARWILWTLYLLRCRCPAVQRLLAYHLDLDWLQQCVSFGVLLDFPGPTDPFRWPTPVLSQMFLDPCVLWFRHEKKARICISHLNTLGVSILPLIPSSASSYFLIFRLYRWYFRFYRIHWFFLGRSSIPLRLFPSSVPPSIAVSFFFFWRPSWDTFDQSLLYDEYYSFKPPRRSIWLTLIFQCFLNLPSYLTNIFFFQFLLREVRFWSLFFTTVRQQCQRRPYKKLYHPFFDGDFKYWEDYPLWILYKLERLYLILPFLPKDLRSLFYENTRVLCDFVKTRTEEMTDDFLVLGLVARAEYWFHRQMGYYEKLKNSSSQNPLLRFFFLVLRFSRFLRRFSFQPIFARSVFSRFTRKIIPSPFSYSIFFPPLLKSRFSFLKKKWKRLKGRRKNTVSFQKLPAEFPLVFSFTREHYWTLLLFWSLSFYFNIQIHRRLFFLVQWLQCSLSFRSLSQMCASPSVSLETIFSSVAHRMNAVEPPFFLVSFYWSFSKPLEASQTVFRQTLRQFFFTGEAPVSSQAIPFFYKRYNYIRRLPFSDFCHFWPQTVNFAQSKIKRHPRQFYGGASREVSVSNPLTYVSSSTKPFALQLQLTDKRVLLHKSLRDVPFL